MNKITIALADDHKLVREGIKSLIESNKLYDVIIEASDGKELIDLIEQSEVRPDIAIVDISMPVMDGYDAIAHFTHHFESIKCIALSMHSDFNSVFKMIDAGARAYLLKECSVQVLHETIMEVHTKGVCYDSFVVDSLMDHKRAQKQGKFNTSTQQLTARETEFLRHCCSEMAYKEIAAKMNISARTVDGYREALFSKLDIKTRVGLVLFAISHNLYNPSFSINI